MRGKSRGRPAIAEIRRDVFTRIPADVYEDACHIANEKGLSLSALVRETVVLLVRVHRRKHPPSVSS
jgi:hypothetical protein